MTQPIENYVTLVEYTVNNGPTTNQQWNNNEPTMDHLLTSNTENIHSNSERKHLQVME